MVESCNYTYIESEKSIPENNYGSGVELVSHNGGELVSIRKKRSYKNTITSTGDRSIKPKNTTTRGKCKGYSKRSKKQFERTCNKINKSKLDQVEKFITLTYSNIPDNWVIVKNHLHRFQKWMKYHYPKSTGFWRIDNQGSRSKKEGGKYCFHLHMLVYQLEYLPNEKLNKWWNKTTGSDVKQRTSVENVRSRKEIHKYMIKYISKRDISKNFQQPELGRIWGSWNKLELNKLIDEDIRVIKDDIVIQDGQSTKTTTPDQYYREFKKTQLRYLDSNSRLKFKKKYRKEYHYQIKKSWNVDITTGEVMGEDVYYHLKDDRLWIRWNDETLKQVIDHIVGLPLEIEGSRKHKTKQVFRDWNRRGL